MTNNGGKIERLTRVSRAFTPGAPIDDYDLFAGRIPQVQDVLSATVQKGQHVALYGERGVGKTSLANILVDIIKRNDAEHWQSMRVNCSTEDTFESLWLNIFRELEIEANGKPPSPEDVRYLLAHLAKPALIVIDELDRLEDDEALTLLADTVKALSDHGVASTVVLVGVAGSIDELIGDHESIARALVKVHMPRMSQRELGEILERGSKHAGISIEPAAVDRITILSRGLPHFTHLLALHAGQRVVQDDRSEITMSDVTAAIETAVEKHVIESDYAKAIHSPHSDNLFEKVLLACALAPQDQFGFFTAGTVRDPLERIAGRRLEIPAFARHLNQFLGFERGSVLERQGSPRRYIYRFKSPILQTYTVLNGIAHELITAEQMTSNEEPVPPMSDESTEPERLF